MGHCPKSGSHVCKLFIPSALTRSDFQQHGHWESSTLEQHREGVEPCRGAACHLL